MRKTFNIGTVLALLALSACSPPMYDEAVVMEAPVVIEEPASPLGSKLGCETTGIDDGIGGTGCPAPIE